MSVASLETMKRSKPAKCMKLLSGDEIAGIQVLTGNSDLLVLTSNGFATLFNENDLTILGSKAGGVKSISGLGKNQAVGLIAFDEDEKGKVALITDKGHQRILDINKVTRTARLGKPTEVCPSFKGDPHKLIGAVKIPKDLDLIKLNLNLSDNSVFTLTIDDFRQTEAKYAKANIGLPTRTFVSYVFDINIAKVNKDSISHPIIVKEPKAPKLDDSSVSEEEKVEENSEEKKEEKSFEQISIFQLDDDEE